MLRIFMGILLSFLLLASKAQAQKDYFSDPNFPLSQSETFEFFDELRSKILPLDATPNLQVEYKTGPNFLEMNLFRWTENKIIFNRRMGPGVWLPPDLDAKTIESFKSDFKTLLAHEYGHSVLLNQFSQHAAIRELFEKAKVIEEGGFTAEDPTFIKLQVLQSFHELLGDLVAALYQGDANTVPRIMAYTYGSKMSYIDEDLYRRSFRLTDFEKKGKGFLRKFGKTLLNDQVSVYHVYFPLRHKIWSELMAQKPAKRPQALAQLTQKFAELGAVLVQNSKYEFTIKELNDFLAKKLSL